MLQRCPEVLHGLFRCALGVGVQLPPPAAIIRRCLLPEGVLCLLPALVQQQRGHRAVPGGQLTHGRVGGQSDSRRPRRCLVVLVPELVDAHQIKGVHQPAAAGVGSVVGIQKFPVVIQHRAAGGGAAGKGEPSGGRLHRLIDPGQKGVHCRLDVIDPAERAHHAVFGQGVALPCRQPRRSDRPRHHRPGGIIVPVGVGFQQPVSGEHGLVRTAVDHLSVGAAAGPVHQAACFKGGGVGQLHADQRRHAPGAGLVFVRGACSVQGQQHPQPGRRGRVLPGGIDTVAAAQRLHPAQNVLRSPGGDVVQIQCQDIPPRDCPRLAAQAVQRTRHEAAHVLQFILLAFGHPEIVRHGFRPPCRYAEAGVQL